MNMPNLKILIYKANIMWFSKKKWFLAIGGVILSTVILVPSIYLPVVNSQKNDTTPDVTPPRPPEPSKPIPITNIGWTKSLEQAHMSRYIDNALLLDAQQKATTDTVLVYSIGQGGQIHKISFVAHILKVLNDNPNKAIWVQNRLGESWDYSQLTNNSSKYPNLVIVDTTDSRYNQIFNNEDANRVNLRFPNKKIDFYSDERLLMAHQTLSFKPENKQTIWNNYAHLANANSIQYITDGLSSSIIEFSNSMLKRYLDVGNVYDANSKSYLKSAQVLEQMQNGSMTQSMFMEGDNAQLYVMSLFTMDFSKDEQLSRFFITTSDYIAEMNSATATNYPMNSGYFSPFNSVNIDLISMIQSISNTTPTYFDNVLNMLKVPTVGPDAFDPNLFITQMSGTATNPKVNYVYAGTFMGNDTILTEQAQTLIGIKKYADENKKPSEEVLVWYKGHPRDTDVLNRLIKKINEIDPTNDGSWLKEMNHTINFEFYAIAGVFDNDPTLHKQVRLFIGYSSIIPLLYANGQNNSVEKIVTTTQYSIEYITGIFGTQSKIFPQEKLISPDSLLG